MSNTRNKLLIIHLSDIHIKVNENSVEDKIESLLRLTTNNLSSVSTVLILVSGDTVFSGKKEEYDIASNMFDKIKSKLSEYSLDPYFVVVPGNHDCDFKENETVRDLVIQNVINNNDLLKNENILNTILSVQKNYIDFQLKYTGKKDRISWVYEIEMPNGKKVRINCFNTALISTLHEKPGSLFIPIDQIREILTDSEADLVISTFHHPRGWLQTSNSQDFLEEIENASDIIFTGHEHLSNRYVKKPVDSDSVLYIEGGVLQDSDNPGNSSFNLLLIDMDSEKYKVGPCVWEKKNYDSSNFNEHRFRDYENLLGKFKKEFDFSDEQKKWLKEPEIDIKHPRKQRIYLNDIYVFPDLKNYNNDIEELDEDGWELQSSKSLIENFEEGKKYLITGDENSGKTSLAKKFVERTHDLGLIPIYIQGSQINKIQDEKVFGIITKTFQNQYRENVNYDEIEITKKVIIIDDFENVKLNRNYKYLLLEQLSNNFKSLVIIGDDLLRFDELIQKKESKKIINKFEQYGLLGFGFDLRSKLVNAWNTIGRVGEIEEDARIRENDNAEKIISNVIGNNLMPSYPIFLLTILQAIESGNPHDLKESSYGHYYQILITRAIGREVKKNEEIEKYYTYLAELSFLIFNKDVEALDLQEYNNFHEFYINKYHLNFIKQDAINALENTGIININHGQVYFKYKYIYYFFIAKYISDNLEKVEIQKTVSKMFERLHQTNFANIIMFLTHHSKHTFILEQILEVSKNQYLNYKPIKLEDDIELLNKLIDEVPNLILPEKDVEENRQKVNREKDSFNYRIMDDDMSEEDNDLESDIDSLDILQCLNRSFKTLEILGQILKNYYAAIDGNRKLELAENAYLLGLRTLNSFFEAFEEGQDFLEEKIQAHIEKEDSEIPNSEKKRIAKQVIFYFAYMVSEAFIRKIGYSVGSDKLKRTFELLRDKHNYNSVLLIDFFITAEFDDGFPINKLKNLASKFESNPLSKTILRQTVINYLYFFPVKDRMRQKICEAIDISIQKQRAIQGKLS